LPDWSTTVHLGVSASVDVVGSVQDVSLKEARTWLFGTVLATTMFTIEVDREDDGRWIAEVADLPGVMAYGQTRQEAIERVQALSLRVLADRLEHGEAVPAMAQVFAVSP
jgi:predicted RNase H-like HicB family nuclease